MVVLSLSFFSVLAWVLFGACFSKDNAGGMNSGGLAESSYIAFTVATALIGLGLPCLAFGLPTNYSLSCVLLRGRARSCACVRARACGECVRA
jgi:hypothetical protein